MSCRVTIYLLTIIFIFSCKKNHDTVLNDEEIGRLIPVYEQVNKAVNGYYIFFPPQYKMSNKSYPLLIFLHGRGQYGNAEMDLELLTNEGILEVMQSGRYPGTFRVDGMDKTMIVVCPQFRYYPGADEIAGLVEFLIKKYKGDKSQVHIAGMSAGGRLAAEAVAEQPDLYASLVTFSGVAVGSGLKNKCRRIVDAEIPLWIFHNDHDEYTSIETSKLFISVFNSLNPKVLPRYTIFPAWGLYGHDSWTKGTDPGFTENGKNIYQWMLQFHK